MRKDITKKFLWKEDRYLDKMISKGIVDFIFRKKINIDTNQISYDVVEFRNVFSTKTTNLNIKNHVGSGHKFKIKKIVKKDGKSIEFNMIYCAEGIFIMGSNNSKDKNPNRGLEIERPFLLSEIEVTQELYELVMGYNPTDRKEADSSQRPVENVTWHDALLFCNKLSVLTNKSPYYEIKNIGEWGPKIVRADVEINEGANGFRLPYEKEWEYAAKAGTNNQWSGTNDESKLEEYAWFDEEWWGAAHPVAQKKPNEWGFYDMSGNVWEWCYDLHNKTSNDRVIRGGSWFNRDASYLRSAYRYAYSLGHRTSYLGFRVAASL